jgi:hypothetical protein
LSKLLGRHTSRRSTLFPSVNCAVKGLLHRYESQKRGLGGQLWLQANAALQFHVEVHLDTWLSPRHSSDGNLDPIAIGVQHATLVIPVPRVSWPVNDQKTVLLHSCSQAINLFL